jgi:hypothetical protein
MMKEVPMHCFYEKGLAFTCVPGCNYCCSCEPGYVFLSQEDLQRLCAYTSMDEDRFIAPIADGGYGSISMVILLEKRITTVFSYETGCSSHANPGNVAPICLEERMENEESWEEKASCSGSDKNGQ